MLYGVYEINIYSSDIWTVTKTDSLFFSIIVKKKEVIFMQINFGAEHHQVVSLFSF